MTEKPSGKSRLNPPVSFLARQPARSRSVNNVLEREAKLQPVRFLERESSVTSNLNSNENTEKKHRVAQIIKRFEKSQSTENLHGSNSNPHVFPSAIPHTSILKSSNDVRTTIVKQNRIPLQALEQSISTPQPSSTTLFSGPKFGTIVHHSTHSISDIIQSIDHTSYDTSHSSILSDIVPVENSMTTVVPHPRALPEEFIKSQSDDYSITTADEQVNRSVDRNRKILHESIKEIYATEVSYVKTLYVLAVKLPAKMKETCHNDQTHLQLFEIIYKPLINTIRRLYKFHCEIILPCIEEYRTGHRTGHIWAVFQEHFQTIEDHYKIYYITYDEYQRELKRLEKSSALKKVHNAMLVCQVFLGNLCPISEFNCPNQRLLRYILLMKNYLKHLDENSSEHEHTSFIHDEFSRIAVRCEEELVISSAQLNRLKGRVDTKLECFDSQQLLWHGPLKKQSARKRNDIAQVYVILFSGCILVYEESGSKLEIKRQLSIENVTVALMEMRQITPSSFYPTIGQQPTPSNCYPFRVNAVEKSYEFLVEKESEREKWVNKIQQANEDFRVRRATTNVSRSSDQLQIGHRAPAWVYDIDVTRCQICHTRFGLKLIPSGRHHCRACGRCICGSCSTKKLPLKYRQKEGDTRVCDTCYTLATGIIKQTISSATITRNPSKTILFGDFRCMSSNSMVWIELQEDHQLHIYAGKLDQVEDFSINLSELRDVSLIPETRLFVFKSKDKRYKYSLELNHHNEYTEKNIKNVRNKPAFYTNLWYETIQSARSHTLPYWYIQKRHSADSGISAF